MAPSIFQQIVLPYLARDSPRSSLHISRCFSTTLIRSRAPANTDSSISSPSSANHATSSTWEYIPPVRPVSYHTGHDPPPPRPIYPDTAVLRPLPRGKSSWKRKDERENSARSREVQAFLRKLENLNLGQKETVIMAMERIISTSSSKVQAGPSEKRPAEQVERASEQDVRSPDDKTVECRSTGYAAPDPESRRKPQRSTALEVQPDENISVSLGQLQHRTMTKETARDLSPTLQTPLQPTFIPPSIHSLLQSRLYRLAVYHLLQTPEYAVDQDLLDRVAEWMRRDGAGKLARRLERGWDGRLADRTGINQDETGSDREGVSRPIDTADPSSTTSSTGASYRLPPDTWQPPRRSSPSSPIPSDPLDRSKALTSAYNAHLSRSLFSPKKSSSSLSPHQSHSTTRPLPRPGTNLAQLRQLLLRIEKLEKHRGFKPDWITANLIVKCWMWCASSDPSRGKKVWTNGGSNSRSATRGNDRDVEEGLGAVELRGIFEFVRRTYEGAVEDQYGACSPKVKKSFGLRNPDPSQTASSQPISTSPTQSDPISRSLTRSNTDMPIKPSSPDLRPQRISYTRHIRPFAHDLARTFRRLGDQEGFERVLGWQKSMRERTGGG